MRTRTILMVLVVLICTTQDNASLITPQGSSEARTSRDWGAGFSASKWVDNEYSPTLGIYYDPSDPSYRW